MTAGFDAAGTLPALRDDLELAAGAPALDGSPTWMIHDPVRNAFFRIGWSAFEILSRWSEGRADVLIERLRRETTCSVDDSDVEQLCAFLAVNQLTRDAHGNPQAWARQHARTRLHWFTRLVHGYLFFRIPLMNPDRFLRRTRRFVEPLFSRFAAILVLLVGSIGVYLTARQWDAFVGTFLHFFSWDGLAFYLGALFAVKVLHEFGHAYTAARYGCRVPSMGVALLVLFPVLYTDTTSTWRLTSRAQRLRVGAAGVVVELAVAMIALALWSFLPDGPARSTAFFLATTSWVLTVVLNFNPFMRFDGYYLLSDWLGVENLQQRSFALGRWRLRELLFALGDAVPEPLPPGLRRGLVVLAWATWLYRLALFIGIALLVYHLFFKLLGIILFTIEVVWLIGWPIGKELRYWWSRWRELIVSRRFPAVLALLAGGAVLILYPWNSTVSFPATLEAARHTTVFPRLPGRVTAVLVRRGESVSAGDTLLTLESPALERDIAATRRRVEMLVLRLSRQAASTEERTALPVVLGELGSERVRLEGLLALREGLDIETPIDGTVADRAPALHPGRWINPATAIATIVSPAGATVRGLVPETEAGRVTPGARGWFIPDDAAREAVALEVSAVSPTVARRIENRYLVSIYGGPIAARRAADGALRPERAMFGVSLAPMHEASAPAHPVPGEAHIEGPARSYAARWYEAVASVLVRESGF